MKKIIGIGQPIFFLNYLQYGNLEPAWIIDKNGGQKGTAHIIELTNDTD